MKVPLGEGDLDAGLSKRPVDRHVELVDRTEAAIDAPREHTQLELQRTVTEPKE